MSLPHPDVLVEQRGPALWLTLNRPERRNALSESLLTQLEAILADVPTNPAVRAVVIAAAGTVFSSGHDLAEMPGRSETEYRTLFERCSRFMLKLRALPQPVIARVQGIATAAGCQLVAASDLAVAVPEAKFATPGVKIGLFCTTPMVPLVRAVPSKVALEMLLTGQPLTAERALAVGLITHIAPAEQLNGVIEEWVQSIAASSPLTLAIGKRAYYAQEGLTEPAAYAESVAVMTQNALCADAQEGITAFLQKRPPNWTGT